MNVTIEYKLHAGEEVESIIPEEVLQSKKCKYPARWELLLNGSSFYNSSVKLFFERILNSFIKEFETNMSLEIKKEQIDDYLSDIEITLLKVWEGLIYDPAKGKYSYSGIKYHPYFEEYNLYGEFISPEKDFLPFFNEKLVELEKYLNLNEEYKKFKIAHKKSPAGNIKIDWNKQVNQLVDFYLNQLQGGLIETDKENLKLFLLNNFTWHGKPLSENTINTLFDSNKEDEKLPKEHKKINPLDFLPE